MQIRRFEAKNMTAALNRIKEELGPEAVILSARSLRKGRGLFGSLKYAGVEVMAAVDPQFPAPPKALSSAGMTGYARYEKNGRPAAPGTRGPERPPVGEEGFRNYMRRQTRQRKKTAAGSGNGKLAALYQQLRSQDLERGIASELIEQVKLAAAAPGAAADGGLKSQLTAALEQIGVLQDPVPADDAMDGIHVLVGTCGVGKTTTIAKLAARQAIRKNRSVGLITMDNYGIAALEQLSAYARIIGIPLETAANRAELKLALKKLKSKDLILIDTPGISPGSSEPIMALKQCFAKLPQIQIHLTLSAGTRKKDLATISAAFEPLCIQWLLFTKLDETSSFGNIINALVRTGLPLSYLSEGRQVPDDLRSGSAKVMAELLLGAEGEAILNSGHAHDSGQIGAAERDAGKAGNERIVANKNSDVYHLSGCKWARRIKPGNMIEFSDPAEAEGRHFLPCRSCNPDRTGGGSAERRDPMQLTNYC